MIKLQSTGVVLSKVKEEPAAETKTFMAKAASIEAKEEPVAGSHEKKAFVAEEAGIEAKEDPAKKGHESNFFTSSAPAFKLTGVKHGIGLVKEAAKQSSNKVNGAKSGSITDHLPKKRQALQRANTFPSKDYQKLSDCFSISPQVSRATAEMKRHYKSKWNGCRTALHSRYFAKTGSGAISNFFRLPK